MTKVLGIVLARMASSRFPGKPLANIASRPMIEHVFLRAQMYSNWDSLLLATCDNEIAQFADSKNMPFIMTSDTHVRCLDRVAEAIDKSKEAISDNDIIVCVQGDEPMLEPEMIEAVIAPLQENKDINAVVLAMDIIDEKQFLDVNTVKIVHDLTNRVLYTSRSPIPYAENFSKDLGAKRIYGIFSFRWHFLKTFNQLSASPLELKESCDSNRIMDHGYSQYAARYPYKNSFAVDCEADLEKVEKFIKNDPYWGKY